MIISLHKDKSHDLSTFEMFLNVISECGRWIVWNSLRQQLCTHAGCAWVWVWWSSNLTLQRRHLWHDQITDCQMQSSYPSDQTYCSSHAVLIVHQDIIMIPHKAPNSALMLLDSLPVQLITDRQDRKGRLQSQLIRNLLHFNVALKSRFSQCESDRRKRVKWHKLSFLSV